MDFEVLEEREARQKLDEQPVNIVVVGAGGGGSNAVNGMIRRGIRGVKFIAVNTDSKDLIKSDADIKLQIGAKLTSGRGAGGKPEVGEKAAVESEAEIREVLKDANMVFVTAGMGGGTGTGSAPVIARIAKGLGALTVGVVTKPFGFERSFRMRLAEDGIRKLREAVDSLIVIPNQKLLDNSDRSVSVLDAFATADEVLLQGVQGISDIIIETGIINIDFADAETVMRDQGDALMSIGYGSGENRVMDAISSAMDNPLLEDTQIKGATRILINVAGSKNLSMVEYNEIVEHITEDTDPDAIVIAGLYINDSMEDRIRVTVIAAGFGKVIDKPETAVPEMISQPRGETVSATEFDTMSGQVKTEAGKAYRSFGGCLSPRNSNYAEDDIDIPPSIRGGTYAAAQLVGGPRYLDFPAKVAAN
ncbi:cell division protein FtsZ [Spirochaetia bacterium]|nr:cell division protein FtsZ [Spirochaetia bacterium]